MSEKKTIPTWGYSKDGDQIFELAPGEALPEGFVDHPAKVKGLAAERQYRADAKKEGASTAFIDPPAKKAEETKKAE